MEIFIGVSCFVGHLYELHMRKVKSRKLTEVFLTAEEGCCILWASMVNMQHEGWMYEDFQGVYRGGKTMSCFEIILDHSEDKVASAEGDGSQAGSHPGDAEEVKMNSLEQQCT